MRRLRQMQQARGGVGGGGPQMPRAAGGALAGGLLLAGGALFLSNSLFNVDGGHRAIKYQRLTGVSKEIYNEGTRINIPDDSDPAQRLIWETYRNTHQHPLV